MKQIFKKNFNFTLVLYSILFFILMFIMKDYSFKDYADDMVYQNTFNEYSNWFCWAQDFYHGWSGRVAIHTLLIIILNLPVVIWQMLISVTIILILHYTLKTATLLSDVSVKSSPLFARIVMTLLPIALPVYFWHMFRDWTITWCTGTMNYLLPGCCLLISLYPVLLHLFQRQPQKKDYIFALIAGIITTSSEQTGAIFLVYSTLLIGYQLIQTKGQSISRPVLALCAALNILSLISILAPGNRLRGSMEVAWFQGFPTLNPADKLILGVQHYTGHMHRNDTLLFIILMFLALFILNRSKKINELYVLLGAAAEAVIMLLSGSGFSEWYINPHWTLYLLWMLLSIGVPFYNAWLLYCTFSTRSTRLALSVTLLYLAAICSCVVLGFTPNMYASGIRAFFTYQMLMYVLVIILFFQIFVTGSTTPKHFLKNLPALSCVTAVLICIIVFIGIYMHTTKPTALSLEGLTPSDTITVNNVSLVEKNGYLQVELLATDEACTFEVDNWVNGVSTSIYMNAQLFIKCKDEYITLSTYPRPDENNTTSVELRGYIPLKIPEDTSSYELGIVTYDLENHALGYQLFDTSISN